MWCYCVVYGRVCVGVYVCVPSGTGHESLKLFGFLGEATHCIVHSVESFREEFCGRCVWERPVPAITDSRQHKAVHLLQPPL